MTVVHTDYRPKRARKLRKPIAIPSRIVTAKKPGRKRPAAAEIPYPKIVEALTPKQLAAVKRWRWMTGMEN